VIDVEEPGASLLTGPLKLSSSWPLNLRAVLCDLRPRFLAKGCAGYGYRWVSRNGKVLLCAERPLDELVDQIAFIRLQTWNRAVLPGERPEPYGLLFCVRSVASPKLRPSPHGPGRPAETFSTRLVPASVQSGELQLDVGGELTLEFRSLASPVNS
jgi:hypothetical protein